MVGDHIFLLGGILREIKKLELRHLSIFKKLLHHHISSLLRIVALQLPIAEAKSEISPTTVVLLHQFRSAFRSVFA